MWFRDYELVDAYKSITEDEDNKGYLLSQCDEEFWYVTLRQTLAEFRKYGGGVVCLYRIRRRGLFGHRIEVERGCKANLVYYSEKNEMLLGDIVADIEGRGYGSRVMENIIKVCRRLKVKLITGEISATDSGDLDKLKHFYPKHGFKIIMYKNSRKGMIGKVERRLSGHSDS